MTSTTKRSKFKIINFQSDSLKSAAKTPTTKTPTTTEMILRWNANPMLVTMRKWSWHGKHVLTLHARSESWSSPCRAFSKSSSSSSSSLQTKGMKPYRYEQKHLRDEDGGTQKTSGSSEEKSEFPSWMKFSMFPLITVLILYLASVLWDEMSWTLDSYVNIPRRKKRLAQIRRELESEEQNQLQQGEGIELPSRD